MKRVLKVKVGWQSPILKILASPALIFCLAVLVQAQNGAASTASSAQPAGSLSEIAGKTRALLIIKRVAVVDASGSHSSIIEEALKTDPRQSRRYRLAYSALGQKLNKYIRKYRSMSAVEQLEEADYIIFFNLLEYRWPLGIPHPYGELYVILNPPPGGKSGPRIIWKSRKVLWAGDAVGDLIKDLKLTRGEN
ncbi:MAG TPA: hypothetical protein VGB17_00500 [Pyrinomonadaceae bacterium]